MIETRRRVTADSTAGFGRLGASKDVSQKPLELTLYLLLFARSVLLELALADDEILSAVDHKPKRSSALRRLADLAANPRVAVLVDAYDEDWARLWWARADGTAEVLHDATSLRRVQDLLRERYPQYAEVPIDGPVIRIRVEAWSGWEFAASS